MGLFAVLAVLPSVSSADPSPPRRPIKVRGAATAALLDGSWALAEHVNAALSVRAWDAPYPLGTLGHYSTRILYGTSWTLMLGLEAIAVAAVHGGKIDWIAEGSYRSDWMMPVDSPVCSSMGAEGGCGLGVGGFSYLQIRPVGSHWWYEAGGGWIQQRVSNDAFRTVAESTCVLTPISAVYELRTDLSAPVAVRLFGGPGVSFGMHAGHMHPTTLGRDLYPNAPWTQLYPMAAGIGPGGRVEARVTFAQRLSLDGELVVAPFLLGGQFDVSNDVAPLERQGHGIPVWRKATVGIGWEDRKTFPFKASIAFFAAELSEQPLDRIGYRGGMIRFDIPLEIVR